MLRPTLDEVRTVLTSALQELSKAPDDVLCSYAPWLTQAYIAWCLERVHRFARSGMVLEDESDLIEIAERWIARIRAEE